MLSTLEKVLSKHFSKFTSVLPHFKNTEYIPIDLSIHSQSLKSVNISDPVEMELFINEFLLNEEKKVAFGGYLEKRNLYDRSNYFNGNSKKNIHLGIDLWCSAYTSVIAPLDGKVHSFANNLNYGDYGPTIILEHSLEDKSFYTLYGHLSIDSLNLNDLKVGKQIKKGETFAQLGDHTENGSYAPHLHFQIIGEMGVYNGDYPGVCDIDSVDFYKNNCPDPNLILQLA